MNPSPTARALPSGGPPADLKELASAASSLAVAAKALAKSPMLLPHGDSKFIKVREEVV